MNKSYRENSYRNLYISLATHCAENSGPLGLVQVLLVASTANYDFAENNPSPPAWYVEYFWYAHIGGGS